MIREINTELITCPWDLDVDALLNLKEAERCRLPDTADSFWSEWNRLTNFGIGCACAFSEKDEKTGKIQREILIRVFRGADTLNTGTQDIKLELCITIPDGPVHCYLYNDCKSQFYSYTSYNPHLKSN